MEGGTRSVDHDHNAPVAMFMSDSRSDGAGHHICSRRANKLQNKFVRVFPIFGQALQLWPCDLCNASMLPVLLVLLLQVLLLLQLQLQLELELELPLLLGTLVPAQCGHSLIWQPFAFN